MVSLHHTPHVVWLGRTMVVAGSLLGCLPAWAQPKPGVESSEPQVRLRLELSHYSYRGGPVSKIAEDPRELIESIATRDAWTLVHRFQTTVPSNEVTSLRVGGTTRVAAGESIRGSGETSPRAVRYQERETGATARFQGLATPHGTIVNFDYECRRIVVPEARDGDGAAPANTIETLNVQTTCRIAPEEPAIVELINGADGRRELLVLYARPEPLGPSAASQRRIDVHIAPVNEAPLRQRYFDYVQAIVRKYDTNHDGKLNAEESERLGPLAFRGATLPDWDANGDGDLTVEELVDGLTKPRAR